MAYQSLSKLFYRDPSPERYRHAEEKARERLLADSTFRTGIDTSSGELFLAVPRELSLLNEDVLTAERSIMGLMDALPVVARRCAVRSLVVDEVVSTNELEGVYSTRRQISELLSQDHDGGAGGERRFRELARLYLGLMDPGCQTPTSPEDIRAVYDRIMDAEPLEAYERPDGRLFRKGEVDIVGPGQKVVHRGLHPEGRIIEAMEDMLRLVASEEIPEVYAAVLGHFVFEYAHPFYDGNGRTGRYLLSLHLDGPLSVATTLSLSRAIAENRGAYYRSFRDAELPLNHGELTPFVISMMETLRAAQDDLIASLSEKRERLARSAEALEGFARANSLARREQAVVDTLLQTYLFAAFPEAPLGEIAEHLGLSGQQARVHVGRLEERGIVEAASRRPLRFRLTERAASELGLR